MLWPLVAVVTGILFAPVVDLRYFWLCFAFAALLSFLSRPAFFIMFALLGVWRKSVEPPVPPDPGDVAVRLVGTLRKPPEWRGVGVYLDVELLAVDARPYWGLARLTEFLDDPKLREMFDALALGSGDRLEVLVKLHRPVVYRNPGVFDFRSHLERQHIYWTGTIRNPRLITVLKRGWHGPDQIKRWILRRLERPFADDPDTKGLIEGMVFGRTYEINARTEHQFQAGGLYHLVVVSGFNLAVIAGLAFRIAQYLPCKRGTRLILVFLATVGYTALVEGQAPVTRAALMVSFIIAGKLLDRGYATGNAIAGSALIILLWNPAALEDPSFQMTFAAVTTVAALGVPAVKWSLGWLRQALTRFNDPDRDARVSPQVADWRVSRRLWCELHGLPTWVLTIPWRILLAIGEMTIISVSIETVFVVFMVQSFHRLSPVSPLLNLPAGLVAMIVTPLGLLVTALPGWATAIPAFVITKLLHELLVILDFALKLRGATFRVPTPPGWIWVAYAAGLIALTVSIRLRRFGMFLASASAVLVLQATVAAADLPEKPPENTRITFLDVGQGDSILLEFPDGRRMLIDGGGVTAARFLGLRNDSTFSIGENVVSPFLWSKGLRKLDVILLTHAHNDHIDGLLNVIENFRVGELWLGRNPMVPAYRELLQRALARQIPIRWLTAGDVVSSSTGYSFTVLHPPANWRPKSHDLNNDSLVFLLNTESVTALFTGDLQRKIRAPGAVDLYKVPHHGSKGVQLQVASRVRVISVGANNPFGHPHPSTLPALRTDQLGAITITLAKSMGMASTLTSPSPWYKLTVLLEGH